jgi:hypothetical protein
MKSNNDKIIQTTFESFEQLLGKYSGEYVKKFSNELCEKLQSLKDIQDEEITNKDSP